MTSIEKSNFCDFVKHVFSLVFVLGFVFFITTFFPIPVHAGEWSVNPVRLELSRDAKTGVITVSNEADDKLHVQISTFDWTQDTTGKDVYTETSDIIFFPRIMILEKKEAKILRAGIKIPAAAKEKTYRLFIEEIPGAKKTEGTTVAIAVRFGIPIFVKPLKEEPKAQIENMAIHMGNLEAIVHNTGNEHVMIKSLTVSGKNSQGQEIFTKELSGWYLLSGISRTYSTEIPPDICKNLSKMTLMVKTDKFNLNGSLDVDKNLCVP
jgi:fimbrial chaperone protein